MRNRLLIGLDPRVVDYDRWPGLTRDKLESAIGADEAKLKDLGRDVFVCFVDRGETAEEVVAEALARRSYDCIVVGAGVRKDDALFLLFEKLINVIHRQAPTAVICFNTGPTDTTAAVQRWV